LDMAKAFYESDESKELSKLRNEVTDGVVFFVPEFGVQ